MNQRVVLSDFYSVFCFKNAKIATVTRDVNLEGISFKYPSVSWLVSIEMNNFVAEWFNLPQAPLPSSTKLLAASQTAKIKT